MGDYGRTFRGLFWFYGIVGALAGLIGAGTIYGIYKVVEAHWR
jgi:hypothetical protein